MSENGGNEVRMKSLTEVVEVRLLVFETVTLEASCEAADGGVADLPP